MNKSFACYFLPSRKKQKSHRKLWESIRFIVGILKNKKRIDFYLFVSKVCVPPVKQSKKTKERKKNSLKTKKNICDSSQSCRIPMSWLHTCCCCWWCCRTCYRGGVWNYRGNCCCDDDLYLTGVYSSSSSTLCVWHVVKNICLPRPQHNNFVS